jgi:hypothetical protein
LSNNTKTFKHPRRFKSFLDIVLILASISLVLSMLISTTNFNTFFFSFGFLFSFFALLIFILDLMSNSKEYTKHFKPRRFTAHLIRFLDKHHLIEEYEP